MGRRLHPARPGELRKFPDAPSKLISSSPFFVFHGKFMEAYRTWFSSSFSSSSQILSEICFPRVMEMLLKYYGSPECHFSTKWGMWLLPSSPRRARLIPHEARKSPESSRWAQIWKLLFIPQFDTFTPHFCVFFVVFFLKPHGTLWIPRRWVLSLLKRSTMVPGWN